MGVTETSLLDITSARDELVQTNQVIAVTERTAEQAEDGSAWRLSLRGFYGLRNELVQELETYARSDDERVQRAAIRALGKAGGEAAVPTLAEALRSPSANVRQEAIWALSEIGSEAALPALAEALRTPDAPTRELAARALGRIGAEGAVSALAEAVDRESPGPVLAAVVAALKFIDTPEAREAAERAGRLPAASR